MLSDEHADLAELRRLVELALQRAQARVRVTRVAGAREPRCFAVGHDAEESPGALLTEGEAQRFVEAINGEAELARAVLRLLVRLDDASEELESGVMRISDHE